MPAATGSCVAERTPRAAGLSFSLAFILALALPGQAQADALLDRLRASASLAGPPAFERTLRLETNGETAPLVRVDRHDPALPDGERWSLLSIDGRSPGDKERDEWRKQVTSQQPPGYHRLHILLAGQPDSIRQEGPLRIYHWKALKPGALGMKGPDFSGRLSAEAILDTSGQEPALQRVRIYAAKPFSIMMVAKMRAFEATSDYKSGANGTPFLVRQTTRTDASIPFRGNGVIRSEARFRPLTKQPHTTQKLTRGQPAAG